MEQPTIFAEGTIANGDLAAAEQLQWPQTTTTPFVSASRRLLERCASWGTRASAAALYCMSESKQTSSSSCSGRLRFIDIVVLFIRTTTGRRALNKGGPKLLESARYRLNTSPVCSACPMAYEHPIDGLSQAHLSSHIMLCAGKTIGRPPQRVLGVHYQSSSRTARRASGARCGR